jgi:SAM-dependent methyltransferase
MHGLEAHLQRQIERSRNLFWHRLRWRVVSEYLPRDESSQVVDVGAGAGLLGSFLARYRPRWRYRFVEPIDSLERYLENRHGVEANVRELDSYEGVGYITLLDVLEHQEDDRRFLKELLARIEPGATLIITVPAMRSLWSGWDVGLGHYRRYDKRGLRRCLEDLPAKILETSYLFPELVPAAFVRKLTRRASTGCGPALEAIAFPDLPRWLNNALYGIGLASLHLRNWWPFGTSLLAVVRRK